MGEFWVTGWGGAGGGIEEVEGIGDLCDDVSMEAPLTELP